MTASKASLDFEYAAISPFTVTSVLQKKNLLGIFLNTSAS